MQPGARQADDDVAGATFAAVDDALALDDADAEAGEVVVAAVVDAGQLGGLAADQRAAGLPAALGDAGDHARGDVDVERAGREVVEEEQRLGAGDEHVVDAHRDEIDADRVVAPVANAVLSLVPTPSVPDTSTGSL